MNITKKWKKWMAVGCSHGDHICPEARRAVLEFKDKWKPDTVLHLGDFIDLAALRAGAQSNPDCSDRAKDIAEDVSEGISFLHELRPNHILFGNHEHRLYSLVNSPNALKAHAANLIVKDIEDCAKQLKAKTYPYQVRSYCQIGDMKALHGFVYNVNAIRDTAASYGCKTLMAHIHRCGQERARTLNGVSGYALGMLMQFDPDYAATRRATLAWSQGFAYGFYTDNQTTVNIVERTYGQPWMLPL
jgi:hypothetical protein